MSYVTAQFSSLKTDLCPPGPAPHPWPQIDAELGSWPLAPVCFCLNSNAGTRPRRDQLSLSEQLLISRIGLSQVTIVCDVQNPYFHSISPSCLACSSQRLAVTDTSRLQDEWQLWVYTQDSNMAEWIYTLNFSFQSKLYRLNLELLFNCIEC